MSILQVQKPLVSFHGDEAVKQKYLGRVRGHRKADEIIHMTYWEKRDGVYKGCAVGCTLHSSDHLAYESELGIPAQLAYIQEGLFERMRRPDDVMFPEQFLEAIPVGVNLYPAFWRFMLFVLVDEKQGLIGVTENDKIQNGIREVADFYQQALDGKDIDLNKYLAARDALDALDARAARAARDALDALDARAARAALDALDVRAARDALDALDARALIWRDKLLECLAEAK